MKGKTIKLYIFGDEFKGLKTAELSNWSGKCYLGERKHSKALLEIEELAAPGIYFLIYQDDSSIQRTVYIGEADEVNKRINNHFRDKEKDWWENFIIFISKDSNLTKAHVRYLEKRFYQIAGANATAFDLRNSSEPSGSKLPLPDIDELEEFLNNMIYLMQNLGIIDFARITANKQALGKDEKDVFYLSLTNDRVDNHGKTLQAKMTITVDGYRLLAGSYIEKEPRQSFLNHAYYPLRRKIEESGSLTRSEYEGCLKVGSDIDFNSPSAAASIVKNRATNGKIEWKLADGTTLDDFENDT